MTRLSIRLRALPLLLVALPLAGLALWQAETAAHARLVTTRLGEVWRLAAILDGEIVALEAELRHLAASPALAGGDQGAVQALATRLGLPIHLGGPAAPPPPGTVQVTVSGTNGALTADWPAARITAGHSDGGPVTLLDREGAPLLGGPPPPSALRATAPQSGYTVALAPPAERASLAEALRQVGLPLAVLLGLATWLAIRGDGGRLAHALAGRAAVERRFRALAQAGGLVLWRGDAAGAIIEAEGWTELTGQSAEALRGNGWLEMVHPEDRMPVINAWGAARQAERPVDLEYRVHTIGGEWHWLRARAVPVGGEWVGLLEDVHERHQAVLDLAERQQKLRLAMDAARLTSWEYDPVADRGSRISSASDDLDAPAEVGFTLADWAAAVHPEDRPETEARMHAVIAGEADEFLAEFRVRRRPPEQGWAWIASQGAVTARDPGGRALRISGISRDISEQREAERRRILLMREVDHRAKNVLAVVQSVLRLTRRDRPESYMAAVEARVAALARAHTLLAEEGWAGADLHLLAERELAALPAGLARLDGPALSIAAGAVQPLAMVLHELAANAVMHGAAAAPGGRITLTWRVGGEEAERRLLLDWTERGGPPVEEPKGRGFGTRMLEAVLRGQLGGSLAFRWAPEGLECHISLPAARVLAAELPQRRRTAPVATPGG